MHPDVYYTCSLRGCADRATDLYHFTFQLQPRHQYNCRHHYLQNLRNDAAEATWDPANRT